ncbi:hypothetical protein KIPB_001956 [Kipferlia bialata]|uniref:Uncharacterized protein n=1 Tax=Kipferlia bialata TaxID=797122 RepID=A0A9K3GEK1_9EUKA|nr:hypothetical protein KIPB_001956 [Kipferlia bialata]|eukprot:g1956.t1
MNAKKSFTIKFDEYVDTQQPYGLKKIVCQAQSDDPSLVRDRMSYDLAESLSIPSLRVSYAGLWINEVYYGLVQIQEPVDKNFYKSRYGNHKGNAYKTHAPASMEYIDDDTDTYRNMENYYMRQYWHVYELMSKDDPTLDPQPYEDLVTVFRLCNETYTDSDSIDALTDAFNLDGFIRAMVLEVVTSQVDGYGFNGNNWRMYNDHDRDLDQYLPFDFSISFGNAINFPYDTTWFVDWSEMDVHEWGTPDFAAGSVLGGTRPMANMMWQHPELKATFDSYLTAVLDNGMSVFGPFLNRADTIHEFVRPYIAKDLWWPLVYGFSMDEFDTSMTDPLVRTVTDPVTGETSDLTLIRWGVEEFVHRRWLSAMEQLGQY